MIQINELIDYKARASRSSFSSDSSAVMRVRLRAPASLAAAAVVNAVLCSLFSYSFMGCVMWGDASEVEGCHVQCCLVFFFLLVVYGMCYLLSC